MKTLNRTIKVTARLFRSKRIDIGKNIGTERTKWNQIAFCNDESWFYLLRMVHREHPVNFIWNEMQSFHQKRILPKNTKVSSLDYRVFTCICGNWFSHFILKFQLISIYLICCISVCLHMHLIATKQKEFHRLRY